MIRVQTYLKVGRDLLPVEAFEGPVQDEDYVEGAIELVANHKPLLAREQVDYVDQLWAYLVEGLHEVCQGREFTTYYPDTAVKIAFQPHGARTRISVDRKRGVAEANVATDEFLRVMVAAATVFFERMRPFMPGHQRDNDAMLARLATMA